MVSTAWWLRTAAGLLSGERVKDTHWNLRPHLKEDAFELIVCLG